MSFQDTISFHVAEILFTSSQPIKKNKPPLEVLQNSSKYLNAFQNTSWHFSLNVINTFLFQLNTWMNILKYKKKVCMGCPFQNCTLLALFLCPILSPQPCVSVGGTFLSRLGDSSIYFSMGTSSIPDWSWRLLVTPRLGSSFQHSWVLQVLPSQLHLLIPAHLMLLLFTRQECWKLPVKLFSVLACLLY